MNPAPDILASPDVTPKNGKERARIRELKKAESFQKLYANTPGFPDSRQVQRRTALLTKKKEIGLAKRQARRDKKAAKRQPRPVIKDE